MSLLGTPPRTALADTSQVQTQQQHAVPTSNSNNDNNGVEHTLNFLHTVGEQGAIDTQLRKNQLIDVMATEQLPHLRSRLLDVILRTNKQDILKALAASPKACRNYHEWIKCALKEPDWVILAKMVQVLHHLPLDSQTLIDFKLGRAIKVLKENCKQNDKEDLLAQTIRLMNKWSEQHNQQRSATRSDANTDSIRDSVSPPSSPSPMVPSVSNITEKRKSPPTTVENPAKKASRLAISSEPPAKASSSSRPQAQVNYGLFKVLNNGRNPSNGSSKLPQLRREESFIAESPPSSSSSSILSPTGSTARYGGGRISRDASVTAHTRAPLTEIHRQNSTSSYFTAPVVPSLSAPNLNGQPTSTVPLKTATSLKKKKKVNFKSDHDLVQVRYYAKNTWNTSDHPHGVIVDDEENEQVPELRGLPTRSHPTLENWHRPPRLLLAQECKGAGIIFTEESNYQRQREATTPPAVYRSIVEIPDSPEEPDSPGCDNEIGVKIIPLDDLANYDESTSEVYYNEEMNGPVLKDDNGYNSAPAVNGSAPVPPTAPASSASDEYPNIDYLDLQGILNAVASQSGSSVPTSTTSSMASAQQQYQVPSQRQHQHYQQDFDAQLPTQPINHHHHSSHSSRGNHRRPHRSSRGGAGRGGHHGGSNRQSKSSRGKAPCKFLNTKKGCLYGDRCNFSHDL